MILDFSLSARHLDRTAYGPRLRRGDSNERSENYSRSHSLSV